MKKANKIKGLEGRSKPFFFALPTSFNSRHKPPIEMQDVDQWLAGTVREAAQLLRLAPVDVFEVEPV